jgi:signal transduction histidine kinase
MNRITSCVVSYTGHLLKTIRDAYRTELARLARDLHDHTAHTICVAVQNLELHEMHANRDIAQAQKKLRRAREAMQHALDSVRYFSAELHTAVRPGGLEQALTEYLAANAEGNVLTSVKVTGDTAMLPEEVCEEVYVTLREAIRNALMHSGATRLDVTVEISESQLLAQVSDTGGGSPSRRRRRLARGLVCSRCKSGCSCSAGRFSCPACWVTAPQ